MVVVNCCKCPPITDKLWQPKAPPMPFGPTRGRTRLAGQTHRQGLLGDIQAKSLRHPGNHHLALAASGLAAASFPFLASQELEPKEGERSVPSPGYLVYCVLMLIERNHIHYYIGSHGELLSSHSASRQTVARRGRRFFPTLSTRDILVKSGSTTVIQLYNTEALCADGSMKYYVQTCLCGSLKAEMSMKLTICFPPTLGAPRIPSHERDFPACCDQLTSFSFTNFLWVYL